MATRKGKSSGRRYGKTAGQEVRTEMHHMRSGKHKVKNRKQAIAIGLSKARQKGTKVPKKEPRNTCTDSQGANWRPSFS